MTDQIWTAEDSLALSALADADAHLYDDVILPSGRRLDADEGNRLIAARRAENVWQVAE